MNDLLIEARVAVLQRRVSRTNIVAAEYDLIFVRLIHGAAVRLFLGVCRYLGIEMYRSGDDN